MCANGCCVVFIALPLRFIRIMVQETRNQFNTAKRQSIKLNYKNIILKLIDCTIAFLVLRLRVNISIRSDGFNYSSRTMPDKVTYPNTDCLNVVSIRYHRKIVALTQDQTHNSCFDEVLYRIISFRDRFQLVNKMMKADSKIIPIGNPIPRPKMKIVFGAVSERKKQRSSDASHSHMNALPFICLKCSCS